MQACWNIGRRRQLIPKIPYGTELLGMAGMALISDVWVFQKENLSGLVRAILCVSCEWRASSD
jgi:hypothetical protein